MHHMDLNILTDSNLAFTLTRLCVCRHRQRPHETSPPTLPPTTQNVAQDDRPHRQS